MERLTKNRQKEIFTNWLQDNKALLFNVTRAYAFNFQDRDDLFQEISIQLWRSIPNYMKQCSVTTWIYRVAFNTAFVWKRKEKKHQLGREADSETHYLLETEEKSNPKLEWLYEQIAKLNKINRSLILLLLDGYSYKEIAEIMGISESNVGVKLNRIKKKLTQKSLEDNL